MLNREQFAKDFKDLVSVTVKSFEGDVDKLSLYAAERTIHLSLMLGESGYDEAVIIERDNIAMKAGILATDQADLFDQRLLGVIHGAIRIGALAIV